MSEQETSKKFLLTVGTGGPGGDGLEGVVAPAQQAHGGLVVVAGEPPASRTADTVYCMV
jgi:NAD(P)H-hydrate repair Nnr-like enzyme with NAD(P)H-hydrate epimerase domain